MDARSRFLDDLSKLMTNAMGVAQGARAEAENAFRGMIDRWLAEQNLVTREEFDAVRAMALKAREENAELQARIAALEAAVAPAPPAEGPTRRAARRSKATD
jgi:BMFP domain-containing protein YqiC